jgi:hypothetical protein
VLCLFSLSLCQLLTDCFVALRCGRHVVLSSSGRNLLLELVTNQEWRARFDPIAFVRNSSDQSVLPAEVPVRVGSLFNMDSLSAALRRLNAERLTPLLMVVAD